MLFTNNCKIFFKFLVLLIVALVAMFSLHKKDPHYGVSKQKADFNKIGEQRDLNRFLFDFNIFDMFLEETKEKDKK